MNFYNCVFPPGSHKIKQKDTLVIKLFTGEGYSSQDRKKVVVFGIIPIIYDMFWIFSKDNYVKN